MAILYTRNIRSDSKVEAENSHLQAWSIRVPIRYQSGKAVESLYKNFIPCGISSNDLEFHTEFHTAPICMVHLG